MGLRPLSGLPIRNTTNDWDCFGPSPTTSIKWYIQDRQDSADSPSMLKCLGWKPSGQQVFWGNLELMCRRRSPGTGPGTCMGKSHP
eukprot:5536204-Pyramimonas_sp.AAC.1